MRNDRQEFVLETTGFLSLHPRFIGRMPGMDGYDMAEQIRATPYDGLSVLMLTSDDLKAGPARANHLGLDGYLVKPVRRIELFEVIAAAMARHNVVLGSNGEKSTALETIDMKLQRPLRILLAEDAMDNRTIIKAYLKHSEARIDEAENGLVAVERMKTNQYDLVLMDIRMPLMDGLQAMALIRQHERQSGLKRTPIIALTASALENDVRDTLDAGADLHVSKPVRKVTLLDAINMVVPAILTSPQSIPQYDSEAYEQDAESACRQNLLDKLAINLREDVAHLS
jgi:two-component system sensor histidine kinase/response regulator